jgi:hypothetical protein
MSNWLPITKANLYDAKVAALVDACDTAALGAGQANRSTNIIQDVVYEIRRKIASHQRNQLDADTTKIPQGLMNMAMDMILARLKIALEIDLGEDERKQLERHAKNLDRIAEGKDVVDQPDAAVVAPMEPLVPPPAFGCWPHRRKNELNG